MASVDTDRQQLTALLEQYRRGFESLDVARLQALWDREYPQLLYVPRERARPIRGWVGISQYYDALRTHLERGSRMSLEDMALDVMGEVAFAFFTYHFEGERVDGAGPFTNDGRVSFVFHRKAGEWRAIHYHESAPGSR
ncbi:nuclear transport factor 2 family protein [Corallococcus sp. bb12-1]|uniref:YybH family protein n=1 Tax=Corallococcus sp. bb12-1 TaxID=2996784 RepID=UPI00226F46B3|nr:nuclear transport factor 2 family protein [Corallococcus sp. bb12-1]MCY1040202.1 nuclear transport factor 2 family protein [Corallococcus sp. bb12-1]